MEVLTALQIERIVEGTEKILEETGFIVENEEILKVAKKKGCLVQETSGRIRIPCNLLRELLSTCPSMYTISDLDGNEHTIGDKNHYCLAIVTDPWIIDYKTQKPRRPSLEDIKRNTIVGQSLPEVKTMSRMDFPVIDFSDSTSSWRALLEHLLHQNKHITFIPGSLEQYRKFKEIRDVLRDDLPSDKNIMSVGIAVISPLKIGNWNAEILLDACRDNIPFFPTVCPIAGMTSPYSRIGTYLQANTESIILAALSQLLKPGIPFRYAVGSSVMDLKTGNDKYYTLDKIFEKLIAGQLARKYNLPYGVECGGTMTYHFDGQSGAEGVLFMIAAYNSGAHLLQGIGSCYNAIGMSAEMMVIQTEWLEVAKYLANDISFNDLDEVIKSIENAVPDGNFLTDSLTLKNLRGKEFFCSDFFDISGDKPMWERAHEKVEQLIANFKSPLKHKMEEKILKHFSDRILKEN